MFHPFGALLLPYLWQPTNLVLLGLLEQILYAKFYTFQSPPHYMGLSSPLDGPVEWRFDSFLEKCTPINRLTRVINVVGARGISLVVSLLERSVPHLSCHSFYINLLLYLSFFTFHSKFTIIALLSPLIYKHTIYLVHSSSTSFLVLFFNW